MDHTECVALLILEAKKMGYRCSLGEAYRSDEQAQVNSIGEQGRLAVARLVSNIFPGLASALRNNGKAGGIAMSNHQVGLAVDLNLFKDGVYLQTTEDHARLGAFWKALHPLARWGGDFRPKPDGNHYSFEYNGVK
jgi:hypothetical protein